MVLACGESEGVEVTVVPSLRRERPGRPVMLQSLGALYAKGFEPAWGQLYGESGRYVSLPRYAWQRRSFWLDGATTARGERRRAAEAAEPSGAQAALPGRRLPTAMPTYELRVEPGLESYMRAHRLDGDPVLPAAAYIELALAAAARSGGAGRHDLDDVAFHEALRLRDGEPRVVQVALHTDRAGGWSFEIHSAPEPEGDEARERTLHASGRWRPAGAGGDAEPVPDEEPGGGAFVGGESPDRAADAVMADRFYRALARRGIDLGAAFRSVERIWPGGGMA